MNDSNALTVKDVVKIIAIAGGFFVGKRLISKLVKKVL